MNRTHSRMGRPAALGVVLLVLLTFLLCPGAVLAQSAKPAAPTPVARLLWEAETSPATADEGALFFNRAPEPISLPAALSLAQTSNLDIAQAREVVVQRSRYS